MLSWKRLIYIVIILLIFSLMFFLFNLDNDFIRTAQRNPADVVVELPAIHNPLPMRKAVSYLVAGSPKDAFEKAVQQNVMQVLDELKVDYTVTDYLYSHDFADKNRSIILVSRNVSPIGDLEEIGIFVKGGGRLLLAAGLPDEADSAYLNAVFGIIERGEYALYEDLRFFETAIPYEEVLLQDSYPTYSYTVRLGGDCERQISSENGIPLTWINRYGQGSCGVINATLMESKLSQGIFIGTLASLQGDFIYPIMDTKTVFLDAIPPLYTDNDDRSFQYYGRSAESFVRDKLWNVLLKTASRLELKYTSSFLGVDTNDVHSTQTNRQTFSFLCKQVLQADGEISLSGNHNELQGITPEMGNSIAEFFKSIFPQYEMYAYFPLYGKGNVQDFRNLQTAFPKMDILRCWYYGDEKNMVTGDFRVDESGTIWYPTVTSGYVANGMQSYTFLSLLTGKGVVSHSFDINGLFTTPKEEYSWNAQQPKYEELCEKFFQKTQWLSPTTVSEAARAVQRQAALDYNWRMEGNTLLLDCDQYTEGQSFFLRTSRPISAIEGAAYEKINAYYYKITISDGKVEIVLGE